MESWTLINEAVMLAASAHAGQVRKGTKIPYIVHPMEVVAIVAGLTDDPEILAAAVLHDVIEDTPYEVGDIEKRFGERVAKLVASDSENKRENRPAQETWKIRKKETHEYVRNVATTEEKMIVMGDKLSNLRAIYRDYLKYGDEVWMKFAVTDKKEHEWYYREFVELLDCFAGTQAYDEYKLLTQKVWG